MDLAEQFENSLRTVEAVPEQSPKASDGPLPETIVNLPNLSSRDALSIRQIIKNYCPFGWKVVVDLPFVPDTNKAMFLLRCSPFSPPLQPLNEGWIATRNVLSPLLHDPFSSADVGDEPINTYGQCPKGVSIVQYQEPPLISILTAFHRYWSGTINFHVRVVGSFISQGYVVSTKLRQLFVPIGKYNEYQDTPLITKPDLSFNYAMQNSYIRTDLTMFRHHEITVPYERQIKVDMQEWGRRVYGAYPDDKKPPGYSPLVEALDDFIAFYPPSPLVSPNTGAQIEFIVEIAAGDDFSLEQPLPLCDTMFMPNSRLITNRDSPTAVRKPNYDIPFIRPNPKLVSDGFSTITKTT